MSSVWDAVYEAVDESSRPRPLHPGVGVAVLGCGQCGRGIDSADMRRAEPVRDATTDSLVIRPIVCASCADIDGGVWW